MKTAKELATEPIEDILKSAPVIVHNVNSMSIYGLMNPLSVSTYMTWMMWAHGRHSSHFIMKMMEQYGAVDYMRPIYLLRDTPQDPEFHPEGDAWEHTLYTVDQMELICLREGIGASKSSPDPIRAALMLAALCHDFGKITHTQVDENGKVTSHGHAEAGEAPTREFLTAIGVPADIIEKVVTLVVLHMAYLHTSKKSMVKLAARLNRVGLSVWHLTLLMEADFRGRPPHDPASRLARVHNWLLSVEDMGIDVRTTVGVEEKKVEPILMGRHLIEMGLKPSPTFAMILHTASLAQHDECFTDLDGAKAWLGSYLRFMGGVDELNKLYVNQKTATPSPSVPSPSETVSDV